MPIFRYFTFAGGALLALLFGASSYFPETSTVTLADVAEPVVRIASDRAGPPRVDFDTRMRTEISPASIAEIQLQESTSVAEPPPSTPLSAPGVPIKIKRKKARAAKRVDGRTMAAGLQGFQPFRFTR
jgi:hypothetical protein